MPVKEFRYLIVNYLPHDSGRAPVSDSEYIALTYFNPLGI